MIKKNNRQAKIVNIFNEALNKQNSGKYDEAIRIYKGLLKNFPGNFSYEININLGKSFFEIGNYLIAAEIFHKLHETQPENVELVNLCGISYLKLDIYDLAITFLTRVVAHQPDNVEAWANLTYAASKKMDNQSAIYYATQALSLNPKDAKLHTNLGSALQAFHRYQDALICFETAQMLVPGDVNSLSNIATILDKFGDHEGALKIFEKLLLNYQIGSEEHTELLFRASFPVLSMGDLNKGWDLYEKGFEINNVRGRNPRRKFINPKWNGEKLNGKRLLIWREQGLGDEVLFFSQLEKIIPLCENIIVECTDRLVNLFKNSFPNCTIRNDPGLNEWVNPSQTDYDFHISVGALPRLFTSNGSNLHRSPGYLKPNPELKKRFASELIKYKGKKLIGITWRSGNLKEERNIHYTALSDWKNILQIPNVQFVNLQYGDCSLEISSVKEHFGVDIINFPYLDIKNDLDSLAGLIANLDQVISISSFTAAFAPALGIKTSLLMHKGWELLGCSHYPWFSNVEPHVSPSISDPLKLLLKDIEIEIRKS